MKLALKFTVAFLAGMCVVLVVYAYSVARREIAMYKLDMKQDDHVLGCALKVPVRKAWESEGEPAILNLMSQVNLSEKPNRVRVQWIWIDPPKGIADGPKLADDVVVRLRDGQDVTYENYGQEEAGRFCTLIPMPIVGAGFGALEISESLEGIHRYTRATITMLLVTTGTVVAVTALLAVSLGIRLVGRPVNSLISHARLVASGSLSGQLRLHRHDELGELANELDIMTDQLETARNREAAETAAKIATIEQLRHADRLSTVGRLAAGVAHELGTPLNVVSARAKMIQTGQAAGDEIESNAQIIVEQSERMTRIIRQLLEFARPHSPHRVWTDLVPIARHTAALFKAMAEKHSIAIQVDEHMPAVWGEVDPNQLEQVLSNLVQNGIQAMQKSGIIDISIGTERIRPPADHGGPEDEYIRLSVRDEGMGISEEHLPHVFEPFFTTKQVGEGTGLGLSVSQGIIREHRGWIAVSSRVGEGTCFAVYLPRGRTDGK